MDRLGIDVDNGVAQLIDTIAMLKTLGIQCEAYITTQNDECSHFHIEAELPTSIILRRFLNDDVMRIALALRRPYREGRPQDLLFEWKGNRKRIKLEEHIKELITDGTQSIGVPEKEIVP